MIKSIRALVFLFLFGIKKNRAILKKCSGYALYRLRSRYKCLSFDSELSEGEVTVTVLDKDKNQIMKSEGVKALIPQGGKYICWDFKNASGKCSLIKFTNEN